jgi:hypothetical protein
MIAESAGCRGAVAGSLCNAGSRTAALAYPALLTGGRGASLRRSPTFRHTCGGATNDCWSAVQDKFLYLSVSRAGATRTRDGRIMRTSGLSAMRRGVISGRAPSVMRQILSCGKGAISRSKA